MIEFDLYVETSTIIKNNKLQFVIWGRFIYLFFNDNELKLFVLKLFDIYSIVFDLAL